MSNRSNNVSRGIFSALWLSFFVSVAFSQVTTSNTQTLPTFSAQERELKGGETHSYRIALTSGQSFYALVEQKEINLYISLFAPDGQEIGDVDSPSDRWGTEPVLLIADKSGDYRVEVRAHDNVAPGRYEIRIVQLREATADDRRLVRAQRLYEEAEKIGNQENAAARRASIEKYQQAAELFAASGEPLRQAYTLRLLIVRFIQLGDYRNFLKYSKEALSLAQSVHDRRLEGTLENFVGGANDFLGEVKEALIHYERAVALARVNGNKATEASALNNIGKIFSDTSDQQKALEYYLQALPLYKPLGNQYGEGITLNNIGIAYNKLGEPQKALDYLQQALPGLRAQGAKGPESLTLSNIGYSYSRLGDNEKALSFYNQARTIQQQIGNKTQEAETLDLLGVFYSQQNQPQKALEHHQEAIQLQRAAGNTRREAISLWNLGHVYLILGRSGDALNSFDQSLSIFRRLGDLNNVANALEGRARAEQRLGKLSESRKSIEESLSLIETVRAQTGSQQLRASYLASREKAYEFYVDLLMQQHAADTTKGYDAEALQASERGRARSLAEMLNEAHVDILQGVDAGLVQKERDIRRTLNAKAQLQIRLTAQKGKQEEINALNKEISALEDDYQQVQAAIRKASPAYAALMQPQPLGLKGIQEQLDANTVLLEYSLGDERSYLWTVTQNSLKTYELPKRDEITRVAQQVYQSLVARSVVKRLETPAERRARIAAADEQFQKAGSELARMIIAPASAEFGTKRLVVVAHGALQYVPFAALPVDGLRPLVVDHEIVSLPSASSLAIQRQTLANRQPALKGIAVVADPVFSAADARFKSSGQAKDVAHAAVSRASDTRILRALVRWPNDRTTCNSALAIYPAGGRADSRGCTCGIQLQSPRLSCKSNARDEWRVEQVSLCSFCHSRLSRPDARRSFRNRAFDDRRAR